jgi:hypothetical protein
MRQKVLFVSSKSEAGCIAPVKKAILGREWLEQLEVGNFAEAATVAQSGFSGLVILSISTKDELVGAINFFKLTATAIKQKIIRVVVFNQLVNDKVEGALTSLGCAEVLGFEVTGKAFLHKLQRHLKLVRAPSSSNTNGAGKISATASAAKGNGSANDELNAASKTVIKMTEPLPHSEDYWLFRTPPDAKRIMGRWLVELVGPGPAIGEWLAVATKQKEKGASTFEWRPRQKDGPFSTPNGSWIFVGRQVDFVWRNDRWRFVGDTVSLTFRRGEEIVAKRFFSDGTDVFHIATNSELAKARLKEIEATFSGENRLDAKKTNAPVEEEDLDFKLLDSTDDGDRGLVHKISKARNHDGKELEITLERPNAGKELEITLERPDAGKELEITLDRPDEGKELEVTLDRPKEGKELSINAADQTEAGAWNDQSGSPDPEAPAFNDHGARRQNVFNSGRGLTQGTQSDHVTYEEEEYETGVDAFKPVGLIATIQGQNAEVQECEESKLTLRVHGGEFRAGDSVLFLVATQNLKPAGSISAKCKILTAERTSDADDIHVEIELDAETTDQWMQLQHAVATRQMNILRFFKMAKGA